MTAGAWYFGRVKRTCTVGTLAALGVLTVAPAARAYEDQATAALSVGYGLVAIPESDLPQHGLAFGLLGSIGLDDAWELRARFDYVYHFGDLPLHVGALGVEAIYQLDIIEVVPFFGAGIDGLATVYDGAFGGELGVHVVLGVDYLLSRDMLIGLDVRPHFLPLSGDIARLEPVYFTVGARVALIFET